MGVALGVGLIVIAQRLTPAIAGDWQPSFGPGRISHPRQPIRLDHLTDSRVFPIHLRERIQDSTTMILRSTLLVFFLLLVVGCSRTDSAWSTSDKIKSELGPPMRLPGHPDYEIRPPKDYELEITDVAGTVIYRWLGPSTRHTESFSTSASYYVRFHTLDPDTFKAQAEWDAESVLETQLDRGRDHAQYSETEMRSRQINGIDMLNKDFTFQHERFGQTRGFVYAALKDGVAIAVYAVEYEGSATPELEIARAATLTLAYRPAAG